jgi:hypothetical protein
MVIQSPSSPETGLVEHRSRRSRAPPGTAGDPSHALRVDLADTVSTVRSTGLDPAPAPAVWRSRTALFVRP